MVALRGSGSPDVAGTVDQAVSERMWRQSRAGTRLHLSLSDCRAEVYLFAEGSPWQKCCSGFKQPAVLLLQQRAGSIPGPLLPWKVLHGGSRTRI